MRDRLLGRLYGLVYPLARAWWRLRAPVRIGVRAVVLDARGRVLLVRHTYGAEGWSFPGGGPARHEPLKDTAVREVREETGVECQVERLLGIYDSFVEGKSDHVALFLCQAISTAEPFPNSPEIVQAAFFPLNALPPNTTAGARRRLAELQDGRPAVSEFW